MPVFKISIERTVEESGEGRIWAPSKAYIRENEEDILCEAEDFIHFEEDEYETRIATIIETTDSRKDLGGDRWFGYVAEDTKKPETLVLPGQLALPQSETEEDQ